VLLVAGCAAGTNPTVDVPDADGSSVGFRSGLWHGIISPVTFVISLFSDNVNFYEVYNSCNGTTSVSCSVSALYSAVEHTERSGSLNSAILFSI